MNKALAKAWITFLQTIGLIPAGGTADQILRKNSTTDYDYSWTDFPAAIKLQGEWDADTNDPDISSTTTTGFAWVVSVAGATDLGGITDWKIGDWAVKTDSGWAKIDSQTIDVSSFVNTTTNQTIDGTKTFNNTPVMTEAEISALEVDWDKPQHYKSISSDSTFTFINDADSKQINVILTATGANRDITWPAGIKWTGGTPEGGTVLEDKTNIYTFFKSDGIVYGAAKIDME